MERKCIEEAVLTEIGGQDGISLLDIPLYPPKQCECGGTLHQDFPTAYKCDSCKYYEIKGKVITRCDGSPTREFTLEEYILYKGVPYKAIRREANVGELILLMDDTLDKRIHKVIDFGGHYKRSIMLENREIIEDHNFYRVLIQLGEVNK